jgi:hypothetical protein
VGKKRTRTEGRLRFRTAQFEPQNRKRRIEMETVSDGVLKMRAKRARAFMQKMVDRLYDGDMTLLRSCECGQCMLVEPGPPTGPHYRFCRPQQEDHHNRSGGELDN